MNKHNSILVFIWFISVVCILIIMLNGCAKRVVYKETYIPIKCDVQIPTRPSLSGDLVSDFAKALEHSELLERDLRFCINGE